MEALSSPSTYQHLEHRPGMRQCAPKILETNSKSIFQSNTIVENTWTCPQFHILTPAHFVQPQHFKLYLYYPMISSICSTSSSPGQASGLSTGVPPGGQSAVSLSPMTYLSIKKHKKRQLGSFSVSPQNDNKSQGCSKSSASGIS